MNGKIACTIGGVDPSGGAGVTADVITFAVFGVHGVTVATAFTFQNTRSAAGYATVGGREIKAQLDAILEDMDVSAVKVGMLAGDAVANALEPYLDVFHKSDVPVVFDPVFRAGVGQPLFEGRPERTFADVVIPHVSLITPNAIELAALIGEEPAQNVGDFRTQVRIYHGRYNSPILATGGHITGTPEVTDIFFNGSEMREFRRRRAPGEIHGTGCLLASAVTAWLANGVDLVTAVEKAEDYATAAIEGAFPAGQGARIADRTAATFHDAEKWRVYANTARAVQILEAAANSFKLIPEVSTNVAYALPDARIPDEVCSIPGRIYRSGNAVHAAAAPAFGAGSHMARAVLAIMTHDRSFRAGMNVRFGDDVLAACRELNYRIAGFDRNEEEPEAATAEDKTIPWGIERAIATAGGIPDVIFDRGSLGKEPMVRVFGTDAVDVVRKAVAISRRLG